LKERVMEHKTQQALLAASVAGLLAVVGSSLWSQQAQAEGGEQAPCYGINKCKGTGDCGGKGHSCAGQNGCEGQAFIKLEKDTCLKIKGGRLTPEAKG
jgi:uncharacterized membrane protein